MFKQSWPVGQAGQGQASIGLDMGAEEAIADAREFLEQPDLVERLLDDFRDLGCIGEEQKALLLYLVGTSRLLGKPVSTIVRGCSSAGKSYLAERVFRLFPDSQKIRATSLSKQALYYFDEDFFRHRLVLIDETCGIHETMDILKLFLSEGELTRLVKGNEGIETRTVYGPIAFVSTSPDRTINDQLLNRNFEVYVDESPEQTRRVQDYQRWTRTREGIDFQEKSGEIVLRHHAIQQMLQPKRVVFPDNLTLDLPSDLPRYRRDAERYYTLVEVVALLHSFQPSRQNGDERFVWANEQDVAIVEKLRMDTIDSGEADGPSEKALNLLKVIKSLAYERAREQSKSVEEVAFTRAELADLTGWSLKKIRNNISSLVDGGQVRQARGGGRGEKCVYQLAI